MDGTAMPFPGKEEALELLKRDYVVDRIPEDMHQKLRCDTERRVEAEEGRC